MSDGRAETVLTSLIELAELYYDCQAKHGALANAVDLGPEGVK
jgi:hypothetical protein